MKASKITSKTIVLIHGLFVNPKSWAEWRAYFEAQGYTVHTPAYLSHTGDPKELRKNIDPKLSAVNFKEVTLNLASFIESLPEKPILIGHSLGGLLVQKLLSMGLGVAGVAIDSAPPVGITPTQWSFWKANLPVVNFIKGNAPFIPTKKWFRYAFGNAVSQAQSDAAFEEFVVPESRNIARGTLFPFAKVDFKKLHKPLLFIAGEKDNIIPAALNKKNFKAYKNKDGVREFKEFSGRGHFICGEPNWQEVAKYAQNWMENV